MMTRYQVWLNGQGLHDISDAIWITDIQEKAPELDVVSMRRPMRDGTLVLARTRSQMEVTIVMQIRAYNIAERKEIMQQVNAWARAGGDLSTSDRPGQRLRVLHNPSALTSALKWTDKVTISFIAYGIPYWEESNPAHVAVNGQGTYELRPVGTAHDTRLTAEITATGNINTLNITADGQTLRLSNIPLSTGSTLVIDYDASGLLVMRVGNVPVLSKRTPDSADEIIIPQNKTTTVTIGANGGFTGKLIARGRFE